MACAAALAPIGMLIALQLGIAPTLAIGALVAFAHLVFQVNIGVLVVDIYPMRQRRDGVRSDRGGQRARRLRIDPARRSAREHWHAYDEIFLLMGMLHPLAWLVAWSSLRGRAMSSIAEFDAAFAPLSAHRDPARRHAR